MLKKLFSGVVGRSEERPASDATATDPANPLAAWLASPEGRGIIKWSGYAEVYHRHFAAFRGRAPAVLEIGVLGGGSLEMWSSYFGPGARIIGVDIDEKCRQYARPGIDVLIGDQADRGFLDAIKAAAPRLDIVIDDGGHTMAQQLITFEALFPHIDPNGIYLCEDTHTSYWPDYGGGFRRPDTFMEFCKGLVDRLNAWHTLEPDAFAPDAFTRSAHSIHFYDSMVVVEKRPMQPPFKVRGGAFAAPGT